MSGAVRMIGSVTQFEQRTAVDGVVVGRVGHDVVGGGEGLHVADLVDRRGGCELLGLLQRGGVEPQGAFPLEDRQRKTEHIVLDSDRIRPLLFGLGVDRTGVGGVGLCAHPRALVVGLACLHRFRMPASAVVRSAIPQQTATSRADLRAALGHPAIVSPMEAAHVRSSNLTRE